LGIFKFVKTSYKQHYNKISLRQYTTDWRVYYISTSSDTVICLQCIPFDLFWFKNNPNCVNAAAAEF